MKRKIANIFIGALVLSPILVITLKIASWMESNPYSDTWLEGLTIIVIILIFIIAMIHLIYMMLIIIEDIGSSVLDKIEQWLLK